MGVKVEENKVLCSNEARAEDEVDIGASVGIGMNKRAERANTEVNTKRGRFVSSSKRGGQTREGKYMR